MVNSSQTFKTGEMSPAAGSFACLLCRGQDRQTVISLQEGGIFPFCEACSAKDVTWKKVS
ncbi:MAG: hypothetical protein V3T95_02745 [Acidobacteriota bacterium]